MMARSATFEKRDIKPNFVIPASPRIVSSSGAGIYYNRHPGEDRDPEFFLVFVFPWIPDQVRNDG
jgi:hypothetical protein